MGDKQKSRISQQTNAGSSQSETVVIRDLRRDEDFVEYENGMQNALEGGDKAALLRFISTCFNTGRAVPEWAQEKFRDAVNKAELHQIKSWEEVFGRPLGKGKQLATERRRKLLAPKIWHRVGELSEAGEPISKPLFDRVGSEFDISGTVAEEIYYKQRRMILGFLTSAKPELQKKILALLNPGKI